MFMMTEWRGDPEHNLFLQQPFFSYYVRQHYLQIGFQRHATGDAQPPFLQRQPSNLFHHSTTHMSKRVSEEHTHKIQCSNIFYTILNRYTSKNFYVK